MHCYKVSNMLENQSKKEEKKIIESWNFITILKLLISGFHGLIENFVFNKPQ